MFRLLSVTLALRYRNKSAEIKDRVIPDFLGAHHRAAAAPTLPSSHVCMAVALSLLV